MVTITGDASVSRWFLTVKARSVSITRTLTDSELMALVDELEAVLHRPQYAKIEIDLGGN